MEKKKLRDHTRGLRDNERQHEKDKKRVKERDRGKKTTERDRDK